MSAPSQIADILEAVCDACADRDALVVDGTRRSFAEFDRRATQLAHWFESQGIGRGDHVGTYLFNSVEYVEAMFAAFKIGAVPINVNYRYVEDELRYLFANADLKAVVFHREFAGRIANVRGDCPALEAFVYVEDGSGADVSTLDAVAFEDAVAAGAPERDFSGRSGDDLFIIYTGGTTGLPKGVMWRHEDAYFACFGGGNPVGDDITDLDALVEKARTTGEYLSMLNTAPLIHGAAQLGTFISLIAGNKVVMQKTFDASDMPRLIEEERITTMSIVGDAMARPFADALEANAAAETPRDVSTLIVISSAGALFSEPVKARLKQYLPNCLLMDNYGSTETGFQGTGSGGETKSFGHGLAFEMNQRTTVLDADLQPVEPGSGVRGRVVLRGHVPIGYYNDAAKTAETFVTIDGVRHSVTGDIAEVLADGTIKLYGRGSQVINSGGEKVFIEEVELALKAHEAVFDAVVVGLDDDRYGQRVVALVSMADGVAASAPAEADLREHCRGHIAGYKVPKEIYVVDEVFRGPNGKADYKLSRATAEELSRAR
ncbi:MAG: acyl-CoA synthetase [Acidimicrobiia bacterium]|nr:acyl-CoA synthetase [Acidimicrobiia bacterium]